MWRGLLLGVSLCCAQDQYHIDDEHALLQARVKQQPEVALSKASPSNLLSTVRNLARTAKQESPETVITLVSSIDATTQAMKPPLQMEHDAAQRQLDAQFAEMEACGDSSSHGTDAAEFAALVTCRADLATATTARDEACDLWDAESLVLEAKDTFPGCLPDSPTTAQLLAHTQAWASFAEAELSGLETKNTNCNDATATLASEEATCGHQQSEFDDAFCNRQRSCALLHACHEHEIAGYNSLVADSESTETARQDQFRSISQVECLLRFITSSVEGNATIEDADLDTCDGSVAVDHLALIVQTPESLPACPSPTAEDPECPTVELPPLWTNGEAAEDAPDEPVLVQYDLGTLFSRTSAKQMCEQEGGRLAYRSELFSGDPHWRDGNNPTGELLINDGNALGGDKFTPVLDPIREGESDSEYDTNGAGWLQVGGDFTGGGAGPGRYLGFTWADIWSGTVQFANLRIVHGLVWCVLS